MDKKEVIELVSTADNNYAQHLGVMLTSVFYNKSINTNINVYIIDGHISAKNKNKLKKIEKKYKFSIKYLNIDKEIYKNYFISEHINESTYYRISIPQLLDEKIKKAIYIDADTIVIGDLSEIWKIDISNYLLAAVKNPYSKYDRIHVLKYPRPEYYFNAGVMIINIDRWRKERISEKINSYIKTNTDKLQWWDQDAINAIIQDKYLRLPPKWNAQTNIFFINVDETSYTKEEYEDVLSKPKIIHYTGKEKPWFWGSDHPYSNYYYKYIIKTPWRFYIPKNFNYINIKYSFLKRNKKLFNILKNIKNKFKKIGIDIPF